VKVDDMELGGLGENVVLPFIGLLPSYGQVDDKIQLF
jgi:hypothetical protein